MPLPMSASAALKMLSPRKNFGAATGQFHNRYTALPRDSSPALEPGGRPRSDSVKRKEPEGPTFAAIAAKNGTGTNFGTCTVNVEHDDEIISDLTLDVVKVRSLLDKAGAEINDLVKDPGTVTVLSTMCEAMRGICSVQDKLATNQLQIRKRCNTGNSGQNMVNLGAIPKKPRQEPVVSGFVRSALAGTGSIGSGQGSAQTFVSGSGAGSAQTYGPSFNRDSLTKSSGPVRTDEEPDPIKRKFKESIKEAEKCTLIFNLNLGRVPIMNRETMNKRATLALASLAATKEKITGSAPSNDTVEAIDDVLSVAQNVSFYGKGTKSYHNPKDPLNGSYCTAPVKYDFLDKDVRFAAEKVLRAKCGINCAVPYPAMIRECIKQIVADVKMKHPNNFVKVNIDVKNYVFKVARKPPSDAPDPDWKNDIPVIPIPVAAMDVGTRQVPKGFKLDIPASVPIQDVAPVTDKVQAPTAPPVPAPDQPLGTAQATTNKDRSKNKKSKNKSKSSTSDFSSGDDMHE
jgi:hypothetical protein